MPVARVLAALLAACLMVPAAAVAQDFVPAPSSPEQAQLRVPRSMVSADFNKDGKADIAFIDGHLAGYGSSETFRNSIEVMLATGGGDFARPAGSPVALPVPYPDAVAAEVVAGDFNNDGNTDLVAAQIDGANLFKTARLSTMLGDGAGGFSAAPGAPTSTPVGYEIPDVVTAFFDGGTNRDVLVSGGQEGQGMLGDGAGSFTEGPDSVHGSCNNDDVATGDFNGDGKADVAVSDNVFCGPAINGAVNIYLGGGDGEFTFAGRTIVQEHTDRGGQLLVANANGDSFQDILDVGYLPGGGVGTNVLISNGSGGLSQAPGSPLADRFALAVGDLDGTANSDMVASYKNRAAACVVILDGQPSGEFAPTASGPELVGHPPVSAATGDFDGDGDRDVAVGYRSAGDDVPDGVAVLLNQSVPGGAGANAGATCDANGAPTVGEYTPPPGGGDPPPGGGEPPPGGGGGGGEPPPPGPTVTGPAGNPLGLPTRRKCVDTRKFSFKLHHAPGARIVKVEVFINGKRKIVKTGTNITRLTLKKLPRKKFKVRIVATQNTGSKLISVRTYKGCKKSRARTRRGGRRR